MFKTMNHSLIKIVIDHYRDYLFLQITLYKDSHINFFKVSNSAVYSELV